MSAYSKKWDQSLAPLREKIFTVSEIVDFLNDLIKPCQVTVRGEVGEKINEYPRFLFFNLVDKKGAVLPCFAFRNVLDEMGVDLKPGMEVKIFGYPEIRKNKGSFNFQVKRMSPVGEGDLKKQFEILKKRLDEEGYFDPIKKKPIPDFPKNIGLITSKGSDAEKDFITHLEDCGFNIFSYNSRVEGDSALDDIINGIEVFSKNFPELDSLVITRGGGSWESLQAFNSEKLVKAVFSCRIPIISGIGHENDVTLIDLVSDLRVSTPTDAGKFLSGSWRDAKGFINQVEKSLNGSTVRMIGEANRFFERSKKLLFFKTSELIRRKEKNLEYLLSGITAKVRLKINQFDYLEREFGSQQKKVKTLLLQQMDRLNVLGESLEKQKSDILEKTESGLIVRSESLRSNGFKIGVAIRRNKEKISDLSYNLEKSKSHWGKVISTALSAEKKRLIISSPNLKLKQGYSITRREGKVVKSSEVLKSGDLITTDFADGTTNSRVQKKDD